MAVGARAVNAEGCPGLAWKVFALRIQSGLGNPRVVSLRRGVPNRTMPNHESYDSPLVTRYASKAMAELFNERTRILTWRRIWLALAESQREVGIPISVQQIRELRRTLEDIDFAAAARYEKKLRHDVMAHVHAWGDVAPKARPILHLGATSAEIVDNADLIILRDALRLIAGWLAAAIDALGTFAKSHRSLPTLGLTHLQPAQLTTCGKRAAMWCYDFVRDLEAVEVRIALLRLRGIKGATGTQASFLALCGGHRGKVQRLERIFVRRIGFDRAEPVTGQTYSRKIDADVVSTLAGIAASVHKFSNDVRILASRKEIEEPFEVEQIGSSAMPYKRNPMRCERATGLARFVLSLASSPHQSAAEQWFERTLDDSSNKRLVIPETFLAVDAMLKLVTNVAKGLVVYPRVIEARVREELPFMVTEDVLMAAVTAGGDRQNLHERIRRHAHAAATRVKDFGEANDLITRLADDAAFSKVNLRRLTDPKRLIGLAPSQVDDFLRDYVRPVRLRYRKSVALDTRLSV